MDRVHAGSWGSPTTANAYGQHGAWPSPQWQKHSPGFAAHRNSGMGWAQPMSPNANKQNRNFEGWGNTFPTNVPHDWGQSEQLHERYFPAPAVRPQSWHTKDAPMDISALDFATAHSTDNKTPVPESTDQQLIRKSSISKDPMLYPEQLRQEQRSPSPNKIPLNLQIPSPTAVHPTKEKQNPFSASTATALSPEEFRNFSPYHDVSSPEDGGNSPNGRRIKGQTFFFDDTKGVWRKEGDKN